jgi:hypothetical protein
MLYTLKFPSLVSPIHVESDKNGEEDFSMLSVTIFVTLSYILLKFSLSYSVAFIPFFDAYIEFGSGPVEYSLLKKR